MQIDDLPYSRELCAGLGEIKDPVAIPNLTEIFINSKKDKRLREICLESIIKIGTQGIFEPLCSALTFPEFVIPAQEALGTLFLQYPDPKILEVLIKAAKGKAKPELLKIVETLEKCLPASENALLQKLLLASLEGVPFTIWGRYSNYLNSTGWKPSGIDEYLIPYFVGRMDSPACDSLSGKVEPFLFEIIKTESDSLDSGIPVFAAKKLFEKCDPGHLSLLFEAFKLTNNPELMEIFSENLPKFGDPAVEGFRNYGRRVFSVACKGLREIGTDKAFNALVEMTFANGSVNNPPEELLKWDPTPEWPPEKLFPLLSSYEEWRAKKVINTFLLGQIFLRKKNILTFKIPPGTFIEYKTLRVFCGESLGNELLKILNNSKEKDEILNLKATIELLLKTQTMVFTLDDTILLCRISDRVWETGGVPSGYRQGGYSDLEAARPTPEKHFVDLNSIRESAAIYLSFFRKE